MEPLLDSLGQSDSDDDEEMETLSPGEGESMALDVDLLSCPREVLLVNEYFFQCLMALSLLLILLMLRTLPTVFKPD